MSPSKRSWKIRQPIGSSYLLADLGHAIYILLVTCGWNSLLYVNQTLARAVAILDSTVKVFHDDSLKFFLSLYGHKLPVMSMDISDDGTLLATGSADKTVKLWGLDFGDCHRSLLAHDDSIMVRSSTCKLLWGG